MLGTPCAFLGRQGAVRVHLALEASEERGAGLGGRLAGVMAGVHGVGGQARPEAPFSRRQRRPAARGRQG